MPRFVKRLQPLTTKQKVERESKSRVTGYKRWVDPFPNVQGTLPEKMVYAELVRLRIPFLFQNNINFSIPEIEFNKDYRPDIAIPSLKIIIEVQGSYWHSKDKAIEDDAYKFAIYQTVGWTVLAWWDYDIMDHLQQLFSEQPQLVAASVFSHDNKSTEYFERKVYRDDSKGIVTMNKNRAQRMQYKKKPVAVKIKKAKKGLFV